MLSASARPCAEVERRLADSQPRRIGMVAKVPQDAITKHAYLAVYAFGGRHAEAMKPAAPTSMRPIVVVARASRLSQKKARIMVTTKAAASARN